MVDNTFLLFWFFFGLLLTDAKQAQGFLSFFKTLPNVSPLFFFYLLGLLIMGFFFL